MVDTATPERPASTSTEGRILRAGRVAWAILGIVGVGAAAVFGLSAVSTVVIPLLFAAVFAVVLQPAVARLQAWGLPRSAAATLLVAAMVAGTVGVVALTVNGIIDQSDELGDQLEAALQRLDVDQPDIDDLRERLEELDPAMRSGAIESVSSGLSMAGQIFIGIFLGTLLLFYLLKDGPMLWRSVRAKVPDLHLRLTDDVFADACYVLRRYWLGRTIISAIVAFVVGIAALILGLPLVPTLIVVTFVGGFIPYIGAFVGGALAVVLALAGSGVGAAVVMLAVTLVANLLIENAVEPIVTGRTLDIHPLVVLLGTAAGGVVAGIVGMVMAVPLAVVTARALPRVLAANDGPEDEAADAAAGEPDVAPPTL